MPRGIPTLIAVLVLLSAVARADTEVSNPRLRVEALTALNDLDASPEQLRLLHRLSRGAATTQPAEKIPNAYRDALTAMIQAFEKDDQPGIGAAQDKIDKVREDLKIDDAPAIDPTDAARERAERALKQFTASQIAGFLADRADDIPSPFETLADAMDDVRGKSDVDFAPLRDRVAKQVAMLLVNGEPRAKDPTEKITAWLTKVHDLSDADYTAKQNDLETEARKLCGQVDPMVTLRHWMLNAMAQILSNPELPGAIETKMRAEEK